MLAAGNSLQLLYAVCEGSVQQMSELVSVNGTDLVGPFPPELNLISKIIAAVSANSREPDAAKAFH